MRRSTIGHVARSSDRGDSNKGKLMNVGRGGALTALVLLVAIGCGGSDAAPPNQGGGGGTGDGGNVVVQLPDGGTIEAPPPPPPPVVGGEPPDGIFVSTSKGLPGADGAKTRPVKTLAEGLTLALKQHLPVIACAETYTEAVVLADGITMYGYFDCSNLDKWKRSDTNARIASPTSPAVSAENLVLPIALAGFDIEAPDLTGSPASGPAASSFGITVRSSKNLSLANLTIRAGRGQDGVDGVEPAAPNAELSPNPEGDPSTIQRKCNVDIDGLSTCMSAKFVAGSSGGVSKCKVGPNGGPGGQGGDAPLVRNGQYAQAVVGPAAGRPSTETNVTVKGGSVAVIGLNPGADAPPAAPGPNGANGQWSFDASGFVVGNGLQGSNGVPGKGGGGGAGTTDRWMVSLTPGGGIQKHPYGSLPTDGTYLGAVGAGGGAGGCGGIAGSAGSGGGASIGLFVSQSEVTLNDSRIISGTGGRAGKGTLGTLGTPGRNGGAADTSDRFHGAAGGRGGDGGPAGLSGHGAPGPSIALVFSGTRPKTSAVELVPGVPGAGADALTRGAQTLPAIVGIAKQEHQF